MSGRKHKRTDQRRRRTRRQKTSISSRHLFAARLHRRPCLWDVLIHELAVVLSNRYRQISDELSTETFQFASEDLTTVGWMLAKGFEIFAAPNWPAGCCEDLKGELWQVDEASAERIAECTLTVAAREDTTATIGQGVGASITDRVPMAMIGRDGRNAHFAAVLEPAVTGKKPGVTGIRCTKTDESLTIAVERGRQTDRVRIFADNRVLVALSQQPAQ